MKSCLNKTNEAANKPHNCPRINDLAPTHTWTWGNLAFTFTPGYAPKSGIKGKEASALACLYIYGRNY